MTVKKNSLRAILALVCVQIFFGVNFVSAKVVVDYLKPTTFASLRFLIAGSIMYVVTSISFKKLYPKIEEAKTWRLIIGLGVFGIAISQSLFLWGLKHSTSTNTAILSTSVPVFTLIIVALRGQSKLGWRELVGFLIAVVALMVFYDVRNASFGSSTMKGDIAILISSTMMAGHISYCKDLFSRVPLFWGTTLLFFCGGLVLLPLAIQDLSSLTQPPPDVFYLAFGYSVIFATLFTYFLNNWAYAHVSPAIISLFIYLQPVVAAVVAVEFLGEVLVTRKIVAGALIFLGMSVALSSTLSSKKATN